MTDTLTRALQALPELPEPAFVLNTGAGIQMVHTADQMHAYARAALAAASAPGVPAGWVPLRIEHEPGYPEDVAFGPQRMMDRLKKWLDKYFAGIVAARNRDPLPLPPMRASIFKHPELGDLYDRLAVQMYAAGYAEDTMAAMLSASPPPPTEQALTWEQVVRQCIADPTQQRLILSVPSDATAEQAEAILAAPPTEQAPIDMVLHCPKCGLQHVDAPEHPGKLGETCDDGGTCHHQCKTECFRRTGCVPLSVSGMTSAWQNPPHRSHLCHGCGHIWRPADVPTNGVAAVKTKGKADSPTEQSEKARQPLTDEQIECLRGLDTDKRVRFYEHDFYVLSNFSAFSLRWKGRFYPTSEHAYHAEKFGNSAETVELFDLMRDMPSAHDAFKLAERNKGWRRKDWDDVKVGIMRGILRAKAAQHEYVRRKLLATGDRELVEDSWRDDFWGWGPNRDGQNMLGRLWMEVRAELRAHGILPATEQKQPLTDGRPIRPEQIDDDPLVDDDMMGASG